HDQARPPETPQRRSERLRVTHHVVLLRIAGVPVGTVVRERRFREGFDADAAEHALGAGFAAPVHLFFSGAVTSLGSFSLQAAKAAWERGSFSSSALMLPGAVMSPV